MYIEFQSFYGIKFCQTGAEGETFFAYYYFAAQTLG